MQRHPQLDDDDEHVLTLPSSPWTYSNDALNPDLHPTSAGKRKSKPRAKKAKAAKGPISSLPPYHPDYEPPLEGDEDGAGGAFVYSSASDTSYSSDGYIEPVIPGAGRVRRGSEGYELPPIDREEMLRRYIEGQVGEAGRYNVYVPEPESESSEDEEARVPLAQKVENWRAATGNGIETIE
jgi:palmitoyltransferase